MTENHFYLGLSGIVREEMALRDCSLQPRLDNLRELARHINVTLDPEPRVLLLAQGQAPRTRDISATDPPGAMRYIPRTRAGDLIVCAPAFPITERALTHAIAQALAERRQQQMPMLIRYGGCIAATAVVSIGESAPHSQTMPNAGPIGFANNRNPQLPEDLDLMAPPIALVRRSER